VVFAVEGWSVKGHDPGGFTRPSLDKAMGVENVFDGGIVSRSVVFALEVMAE
jgi:hypothetical protein